MIIGIGLDKLQTAAKDTVMRYFVNMAEGDGTPPTLRAMYVLKTAEARTVAAGGTSDYITKEAKMRGLTAQQMADMIIGLANQSEALELERMKANIAIDAAKDEVTIHRVLDDLGLKVSIDL